MKLQATDPSNFWNLLKQLKTSGKFVSDKEDVPPLDEMQDHYMKFLQKQAVCNSFNNEKIKLRNKLNLDQLNKPFDLEEIKQGIKRLKTKKAQGIDCISSEMIKCSNNALLSKITKLFNLILDSGYYPETWNHGLIHSMHKIVHSIHKNGSKSFSKKELRIVASKPSFTLIKMKITFFHKQKNSLKRKGI